MTEAEAKQAVYNAWLAAWDGALHPDVASVFGNEGKSSADRWVRVTMKHAGSLQVSFGPVGTRRFQRSGYVVVQLFSVTNDGDAEMSALADDARKVLEGTSFGTGEPVRTYAGQTKELDTDGRWNQSQVLVPFEYFETR